MRIIAARYLIPQGFAGITIYPFILVRDNVLKNNAVFINHEKIHLRQQAELLILPFYIWYGLEYFMRLVYYGNRRKAYRNISFEREAYQHETKTNYLSNRKSWNFINFIFIKP